jgi:Terminase large subunit, T4likevirus-type, N-terminal
VKILLQPKQKQFYELIESENPALALCYGGARGGAKSGGLRRILLLLLGAHPGTNALLLRRTFPEVQKNHILKLWEEFPGLRENYNVQDKILTLPNGSMLHFGYAEHKGDSENYRGQGFDWIVVDDCGSFDPWDLAFLRSCVRSTKPGIRPRIIYLPNPGDRAHSYLKRLFVDRKFEETENPTDYAPLLQAYGWDNVEWVRGELQEVAVSAKQYYEWPEDKRREWFLRSNYGRQLMSLPKHLQRAHLWGDWDLFAGQYFDCWNESVMTYDPANPPWLEDKTTSTVGVPEWWPRCLAVDYGFDHPASAHWSATDVAGKTYVYREHVESGKTPGQLGETLRLMTGSEALDAFYLSPDSFAKRQSIRTIADEIGDRRGPLPFPTPADNDRPGGALLLYQLLSEGRLMISRACPRLIALIPTLIQDPDRASDVLKVDGDDEYDSWRYLLKSRARVAKVPTDVVIAERVSRLEDPTMKAIQYRRLVAESRRSEAPVTWRRGRA